jgi:hypothetical protein
MKVLAAAGMLDLSIPAAEPKDEAATRATREV